MEGRLMNLDSENMKRSHLFTTIQWHYKLVREMWQEKSFPYRVLSCFLCRPKIYRPAKDNGAEVAPF